MLEFRMALLDAEGRPVLVTFIGGRQLSNIDKRPEFPDARPAPRLRADPSRVVIGLGGRAPLTPA